MNWTLVIIALWTALLGAAACRAQECQPYWTGLPTLGAGVSSIVTFDEGRNGPALYVSANWNGYPNYPNPVRRWNGNAFIAVGSGLFGDSNTIQVLDDGGGLRLYHHRTTPQGVRMMYRLTGSVWKRVLPEMFVSHLPLPGPFVAPHFSTNQGIVAGMYGFFRESGVPNARYRIRRWTGFDWKAFGDIGLGDGYDEIAVYDAGTGPNLLVSGSFQSISGVAAPYLARWDGHNWHAMGDAPSAAHAIITWDDGTGPSLYIGFTGSSTSNPLRREGIARWTGSTWVSVGGGVKWAPAGPGGIEDMIIFDDGTGPALFVTGGFDTAGTTPARNIAKWDGTQWHALGAGVSGAPTTLAVADDGRGLSLFVKGNPMATCGGGLVYDIAQWVGCAGNRQCYPDCDNNRKLNANDFICYLTKFAAKDPYANCDVSTAAPAINAADFACYLTKYAAGCP